MFYTLRVLFSLIAYGVAVSTLPVVSTVPSLTVKTSTSNVNIDGLKNLKVTATIVNTGGETLKLLNDPRGVLDPFPEDSFTITDPSGSGPAFNGASVDYSPADAAGIGGHNVFTVLAPGDSINITHDLSAAYDFTRSGAGDYSIKPSNLFTYVDGDGTPKGLYATVEHIAKVKLSGDFVVPRHVRSKRAFVGCSDTQQMVVEAAIEAAKHRVEKSLIYLDSISAPTARYETWFGEYDEGRKETVRSSFQKMLQVADFSSLTYDCTCPDPSKPITIAYVSKKGGRNRKVYLCRRFWRLPVTGTKTQYGTLIHESSHFRVNGSTKDKCYGRSRCMELAAMDPELAVKNADSLRFFAENNPYLH